MVKLNTLPNGNTPNKVSLSELRTLQKSKHDCSKRVEDLKYKLFQMTEKHMDQAIIILKNWTKN